MSSLPPGVPPEPPVPGAWRSARLTSKRRETARAASLAFEVVPWPGHRPGQHIDVRLTAEDGYHAERSYSIASPPEDMGVEITVDRLEDGEVSPFLVDDMQDGDTLEVRGPIGGWFAWDVRDGGPLLMMAGGSGIVPLMAMLRHRRRRASTIPARLLVSVRTEADLFYTNELAELQAAGDGFELFVTLTREAPAGWSGLTGRISREMLAGVVWPSPDSTRVFICGPNAFVEKAGWIIVDLGYPPAHVRTERFGPSGT